MSWFSMRPQHLLIPLVLATVIGCQDSIPTSSTGPLDSPTPRFSAFPGSNGKIAFAGGVLGGIQTMNSDGSGVQALTSSGAAPAWSADGARLAFNSSDDGNDEIYVVNADGSALTQLTFTSAPTGQTVGMTFPSWSPDGSRIAFQNNFDRRIYVMDSDGSNVTALTNNPGGGIDYVPAWSPDGARLAFTSTRDGQLEIYVMNADGTNQTRLTNDVQRD